MPGRIKDTSNVEVVGLFTFQASDFHVPFNTPMLTAQSRVS